MTSDYEHLLGISLQSPRVRDNSKTKKNKKKKRKENNKTWSCTDERACWEIKQAEKAPVTPSDGFSDRAFLEYRVTLSSSCPN